MAQGSLRNRRSARRLAAGVCACVAGVGLAHAGIEAFAIEQIFSNADGSVQFVVLHDGANQDNAHAWLGRTLAATHAGVTVTFTFPGDLPLPLTAGRRVLLGSAGFAALGLVGPDYVLPDRFLPTDGGTLAIGGGDSLAYGPLPADGTTAVARNGSAQPNVATNFAGATASVPPRAVTAVEYRNAALDHYFVSDLAPDLVALDTGRIPGWSRTGHAFKVQPAATADAPNAVCRFYIPPAHGDSHFFSASAQECTAVAQKALTDPAYSGYVQETASAFYVALPDPVTGACPAGLLPVYRLWNARPQSNHRYATSAGVRAQMQAAGWVPEGYGPDSAAMCVPPGTATVRLAGGADAPFGALVSDASSTPATAFQAYAMPADAVDVGARRGSGEVVAYGSERAPTVRAQAWDTTQGDQIVTVPFAPQLAIPVTVWVLAGPFATTQQTAFDLWQTAQAIFAAERLGVRMDTLEVVDATAQPAATAWQSFTCGGGNANVAALQNAIGARAGRINVYLVTLVDGSTSRGNACIVGGGFVAIASGAGSELLAHELGHDLALEHVDDLAGAFDATNVMHSASSVRRFLTEGQTFRAHLRGASALNGVYGLRSGLPVRECDRDTPASGCVRIDQRVWADGTFGPN